MTVLLAYPGLSLLIPGESWAEAHGLPVSAGCRRTQKSGAGPPPPCYVVQHPRRPAQSSGRGPDAPSLSVLGLCADAPSHGL